MSVPTLRCLVVGMGSISKTMLRALRDQPWYETAGVVDVRDDALAKAGRALGLPGGALFRDLETALEQANADVAIVNTPSEFHFAQTRAALKAGLHVLVAKPVTNDFDQAVELVALAGRVGRTLAVGQQMRYRRHYQVVAEFLAGGQLGSVEAVNLFNTKPRHQAVNLASMDQPALYEMSCHHFDCLMSLVPDKVPEQIVGDGFRPSWSVYAGPCMVNALIRFSGGLHVLYQGGFSSQADNYELRLEGSRGALRCRGIHMSNDAMTYEFAERGGAFAPIDLDSDVPAGDPWLPFFSRWRDYLRGGAEPPFSGCNNLKVFALLSAGIDSVVTGRPVEVAGNPHYAVAFAAER